MKQNYLPTALVLLFLSITSLSFSTTYYSIANTGWTTPSTWSTVSCGGAASLTSPGSSDDVVICSGTTVTMNGNSGACNSLTIAGTADWTSAFTTNVGAGGITINVGGNITGAVAGILTTTGGLTLNATLSSASVTIKTITTPSQIITGTGSLAKLDISASTTINGTITVTTTLASTTLSTLTIGASGTLNFNGTTVTPTLDATASGSVVGYGGGNQNVKSTTYHHLNISGTLTKTLAGNITVNGNLTVNASELYTSSFQITGNASGTFTVAAGAIFTLGTNSLFPTNFTTGHSSFSASSTTYYIGGNAQVISSVPTYGILRIQGYSGSKAADGNITIAGNLITTSPTVFDMSTYTLNLTGTYTGTGALSFTSGTFNITGTYTNSGTFTCGTGTVNYNGTVQSVKSTTYNHLTISGSNQKTLGGAITVNGNLNVSAGVLYGSIYQITGNASGTFTLAAGTSLYIGDNNSATDILFPTNFTSVNCSLSSTSTVYYYGNNAQTVSSTPTYGNLTLQAYSGSKTADGNLTVAGNLVVTSPTTLSMTSNTLDLTGNYTGTGALSFTSGIFNITGTNTNSGTFTCGTGTVNYNGGGAQTVAGVNYNNLTFSGVGTKTLQAAATIGIAGNFIRGTMTVTPGATNTVLFNGGAQTMTGSATSFTNLTLANTSLSAPADFTISGTLTTTSPAILSMTSYTLNLTGDYAGTGALSFTSGTFNISGSYSNSGAFTCGTGTVNYNGGGAQAVRGVNYNHLTFSGVGTKTLQAAATIGIAGAFTRGTMTVTAGATNTVLFNGGSQTMTGNATTFVNLTISNTSLTIPADITISSTLTFTTGNIITGSHIVILTSTGSIARTSGYVDGNLRKYVALGSNVSVTFEIGNGSDYTPLSFLFATVSTAGSLTALSTAGDHPSIGTSGFNAAKTVNRYWTITNSGIVYTSYDVTANFVNGDKDAGLNTANSIIKIYDGSLWVTPGTGTQGANSTQTLTASVPVTPNTAYIQIGEIVPSSTGSVYSIATGSWSTPGTWSETSGGPNCGCIPTVADNVIIENSFAVTMNGNPGSAKSLTIQTGGSATWASAITTNIGSGGITIASTGDITGSGAGILTTTGGLTLNKVLTSTTVTIKLMTTAGQVISGTGTLAKLDISASTTNNGNITVTTTLSSTVASTLTQGGSATLTYNGTTAVGPTLNASASGNTVNYAGGNGIVKSATYHHLSISGTSFKSLGGAITVNGNLTVASSELYTSVYQITGNATGVLTVASGAILTIGNNVSPTVVAFPTNFTASNISLSASSLVYYLGNGAQVISSIPTYGRLLVQTFSGSKTADGNITVNGNLSVTSPTTLDMGSYTLNEAANYIGTGALSFTSGTFNLTGLYSNTGAFTCGTGTVNYMGGSGQTIRGATNYYHLIFSGAGAKTLQAATTIGIAGNFTRGTMTVTAGATNTVLFNGISQTMTGNATTFVNVTLNNTSLTISSNITITGTLTLTSGRIITGANTVIISTSTAVSRTSGHIDGNLRKYVATGSSVHVTFEIGTGTLYAPLDITFASVSVAGDLTAFSTATDHPAIATSTFEPSATVNRYWTLTNAGIVFTNYNVTATYVDADKDPLFHSTMGIIQLYNGSAWSIPTAGSKTANSTQATGITIPATPNTIYLQVGQKTSTTGNTYSIATNNWTDVATWSETSGGAACLCLPTSRDNAYIENSHVVNVDQDNIGIKSLNITTGGVANWDLAYTTTVGVNGIVIDATGDITSTVDNILETAGGLVLDNTLSSTTATIKTINTAGQNISGSGTLANLNIDVNTTHNGTISLTDVLTITSGTFTNTGTFRLRADATKYARIAPISCSGCGFSGNFVIELYIPERDTGVWANLSSPVSNATMTDWDDELYLVYPFTGFDWNTNRPTGTNVLAYDEPSAVYVELNPSTPLSTGKGFEIGLTDDSTANHFNSLLLTTIGTPNTGTIDIPLDFTDANGPAYPIGYTGENLIGNPFASAIDFSMITITNALPSVDVYDYTIDNYKTLSGTDLIGPHQGFWAYAQSAGASFTIPEDAKSTNTTTGLQRPNRSGSGSNSYLNLTLSSADGSHHMEHTLKIACNENAQDGWDNSDHPFRKSLNPKAPSITSNAEKAIVTINTFNNNHETYIMPLHVQVGIDGKYRINASGIKNITKDFPVVMLEDKTTKKFINLNSSTDYIFSAHSADATDRFVLHFSKSLSYTPSSTKSSATNEIQISQNKEGNVVHFDNTESENTTISVFDLLGKRIIDDIVIQALDQTVNITIPESFHGMYIVAVQSGSTKTVKKFNSFR